MSDKHPPLPRSLWFGLAIFLAATITGVTLAILDKSGPTPVVLTPVELPAFTLTNQNGVPFTRESLRGNVWVADIIFTRCASICPVMTRKLQSIQAALPAGSRTRLLTLTTDADFDTAEVLNQYGLRFGADFNRWTFLTGPKHAIAALAANGLQLSAQPVKAADQANAADLFIHSTMFVVVDKHARVRKTFETGGSGVEWTNVQPAILELVKYLESEP